MAACTSLAATADTGATPNTSDAFSPASNDLLVVFVLASGTADVAPTLTSSIGGFTFSLVSTIATSTSNTLSHYMFVADALVNDTSSQTVTADCPSDSATGTIIWVVGISGMSKTGLTAVRQTAKEDNISGGTAPNPTFSGSCLTGNPILCGYGHNDDTPNATPPTGWTEAFDGGYTSPVVGANYAFRDSGFTGTALTWNSTPSGGTFNSLAIELDASSSSSSTISPNPAGLLAV